MSLASKFKFEVFSFFGFAPNERSFGSSIRGRLRISKTETKCTPVSLMQDIILLEGK